jgi:hypothetical protein
VKSQATVDPQEVFSRILEALGAKNAPEAARLLGITKQAVYDWQKNTPGIDNLLKVAKSSNTSLHWILTGEGERIVNSEKKISIEEAIERRVREIVREEFVLLTKTEQPPQELGTVDEFDIEAAVKKYDNAGAVLRDWYRHDGIPMPDVSGLAFADWQKMSLAAKIKEVTNTRKNIDNALYFEERKRASTKPKDT